MATRFFRHNPSDPYATLPSTRSLMGYESGVGSWTSGYGDVEDIAKLAETWGMKAYEVYQLQEQLVQVNRTRKSHGQFPLTLSQLKAMMEKGVDPTAYTPPGSGGGGVPAPAAAGGGMMVALLPLVLMMMMGKR